MEKIFEIATLYDFYGELLNDHQKRILEDYVMNNLSLSEIAEEEGTSRQAVHDLVKRAEKSLLDYEERLHLVAKFNSVKINVSKINELTGKLENPEEKDVVDRIKKLSDEILDEL